jgi:dienelactone hydrolase
MPHSSGPFEVEVFLPTPNGRVPVLMMYSGNRGRRPAILLYPGLSSAKEVQRKELSWLASAGFLAIAVDNVGHGKRRDPDFDQRHHGPDWHGHFLRWTYATVREVPALLDALQDFLGDGLGPIGITGISMGGYIAYGAAPLDARLKAAVPILGSPDWRPKQPGTPTDEWIVGQSPCFRPELYAQIPLLAFNAGRDDSVPAAPSRDFIQALRERHGASPDRVQFVEYPESTHFMREQDWNDLWERAIAFFRAHLIAQP